MRKLSLCVRNGSKDFMKEFEIKKDINKILNQIFYKSSQDMSELEDCSVDLIITSPPYFNIKDYAKDGY